MWVRISNVLFNLETGVSIILMPHRIVWTGREGDQREIVVSEYDSYMQRAFDGMSAMLKAVRLVEV